MRFLYARLCMIGVAATWGVLPVCIVSGCNPLLVSAVFTFIAVYVWGKTGNPALREKLRPLKAQAGTGLLTVALMVFPGSLLLVIRYFEVSPHRPNSMGSLGLLVLSFIIGCSISLLLSWVGIRWIFPKNKKEKEG